MSLLSDDSTLQKFPASFRFGVATADHQCEAYIADFEDVADVWERASNKTLRGRATDFWDRYPEDIALAKSLGCKIFRLSVSWSRLEPTPGHYSDTAFEHYRAVLRAIRTAGMEAVVTIVHFAWPKHVEARGGLTSPDFPAIFSTYMAEFANRLGNEARYWIPFNEPTILTNGYLNFSGGTAYNLPPGLPAGTTLPDQLGAVSNFVHNMFVAHTIARTALKRVNPDAQVGCNPNGLGVPIWLQKWLDGNVMRLRSRQDQINTGQRYAARPVLERGEVDLVLAMLTRTNGRQQQVAFSETYFVAGQTLLVKTGSTVQGSVDLNGQSVAVIRTSTAEQSLSTLIPGALARVFGTYDAALSDLDQGVVAALLADNVILDGLILKHPGSYKLVGGLLTTEPYAAAVALGNHDLLDVVNIALQQFMDSGAWAASYARNLPGQPVPHVPGNCTQELCTLRGTDPSEAARQRLGMHNGKLPLAKPATLLRHIQDRGSLVVAVKTDVPGFSVLDAATGQYSGFEIDLARQVATVIFGDPSRIQFRPAVTQERIPMLRSLIRFLDPLINLYNVFSTWINANWWHLGMAGKLPEFMCPPECVGQQDFIGFDYYWGISDLRLDRIRHLINTYVVGADQSQAPVWPLGIYREIKYLAELFPGQPIMVIENGCITVADGIDRADYLRRHIHEVQRAVHDGMNVIAYVCWSITSNREWGAKFGDRSDYGLYHIDLDNDPGLKRISTPAAEEYRAIIAANGA